MKAFHNDPEIKEKYLCESAHCRGFIKDKDKDGAVIMDEEIGIINKSKIKMMFCDDYCKDDYIKHKQHIEWIAMGRKNESE